MNGFVKVKESGSTKLQPGTPLKSEYDRNSIRNDDLFIFIYFCSRRGMNAINHCCNSVRDFYRLTWFQISLKTEIYTTIYPVILHTCKKQYCILREQIASVWRKIALEGVWIWQLWSEEKPDVFYSDKLGDS